MEDYVNFETSKLLDECGFDDKCSFVYFHDGARMSAAHFMEGESAVNKEDIRLVAKYTEWSIAQGNYAFLCPTLYRTMKWLREKHQMEVVVLHDATEHDAWWYRIDKPHAGNIETLGKSDAVYKTYESAVEDAVDECLDIILSEIEMQDDYVSLRTAKLLKDHGFNEYTMYKYSDGNNVKTYFYEHKEFKNSELLNGYSAPTLQLAMKWLRKVHKIDIDIKTYWKITKTGYSTNGYRFELHYADAPNHSFSDAFDTYEEACEAAIIYCLENLCEHGYK